MAQRADGVDGLRIGVAVVFTVLPIALLLWLFYTRDVRREPRGAVVKTFLLGGVITLAAVLPELILLSVAGRAMGVFSGAAYDAFLVAALPEELLKLLVIAFYCARRRSFDELMDGIVYGATAALGFAAAENAMYVAQGGWIVAVMRSATAVPMHAAMGAILGYYVAQQRLLFRRGAVWSGLAIAVLVHGLYDFGPMVLMRLGAAGAKATRVGLVALFALILFVGIVATTLWAVSRLVKRLRVEQLRRSAVEAAKQVPPPSPEDPLGAHLLGRTSKVTRLPVEDPESHETPSKKRDTCD